MNERVGKLWMRATVTAFLLILALILRYWKYIWEQTNVCSVSIQPSDWIAVLVFPIAHRLPVGTCHKHIHYEWLTTHFSSRHKLYPSKYTLIHLFCSFGILIVIRSPFSAIAFMGACFDIISLHVDIILLTSSTHFKPCWRSFLHECSQLNGIDFFFTCWLHWASLIGFSLWFISYSFSLCFSLFMVYTQINAMCLTHTHTYTQEWMRPIH